MVRNLPVGIWQWAYSLNSYSGYVDAGGVAPIWARTREGALIYEFKYQVGVSASRRQEIIDLLLVGLSEFIEENVIRVYNGIPFDKVISVPSNRAGHTSLPEALGRRLCQLHPQLSYIEEPLLKTRAAETMKEVPKERRPLSVKGLYQVNPSLSNLDSKGILVIDDVFETGSTLNSVCDAVATRFAGLKIFVVTITDLGAGR